MAKRTHKRVKSAQYADYNEFLDDEARVALDDDQLQERDYNEFADFLEDEDPESDGLTLSIAMERLSPILSDTWSSLLERAYKRARKNLAPFEEDGSRSLGALWRVRVKFIQQVSGRKDNVSGYIGSIIGRRSCPGWVYVEAHAASNVQKLCTNVSNLYVNTISLVPNEDTLSCIIPAPLYAPMPHSFVRITKSSLYLNDIAYVYQWDTDRGADVCLVPRLNLDHRQSSMSYRPAPALVLLDHLQRVFPTDHIAVLRLEDILKVFGSNGIKSLSSKDGQAHWEGGFQFRGKIYTGGYLRMWTHFVEPAVPTATQVATFSLCPGILARAVQVASVELEVLRLNIGDRVKMVRGQLCGRVGVITMLEESMASVHMEDSSEIITMPHIYCRKDIQVGDAVQIVDGPYKGTLGWIVGIEDRLVRLLEEGDNTFRELQVLRSSVVFHSAPQVLHSQEPALPLCLPSRKAQDPLHFLKGREVTIVGQSHFKGYEGRIKDSLHNGSLIVEIDARGHNVVVEASNVANRGPTLQTLTADIETLSSRPLTKSIALPAGTSVAQHLAWHHPVTTMPDKNSSLQSRLASTMSTPIPSLASTTPAWNPSSRTPEHILQASDCDNGWMNHDNLKKTLKFKLKRKAECGTALPMGLWQAGNFAGPGVLRVRFGSNWENIGQHLVTPLHPTKKGVRVVVTDVDNACFCEELYVVHWDAEICRVRPYYKSKDAENMERFFTVATSSRWAILYVKLTRDDHGYWEWTETYIYMDNAQAITRQIHRHEPPYEEMYMCAWFGSKNEQGPDLVPVPADIGYSCCWEIKHMAAQLWVQLTEHGEELIDLDKMGLVVASDKDPQVVSPDRTSGINRAKVGVENFIDPMIDV
ncbi:hypothetical protein H0H93_011474 [Arthromyces matolae]|nr:hypothetical protein H0H93_011474 [Arthromyces matolae]